MTDFIIVLTTCADEEQSSLIARALIDDRLAACVNILPRIQSVYRWKGEVERAEEILLLIKTTRARFPALRDRIVALHSYEVPEIIAVPIAAGLEKYLGWLQESTTCDSF